MNRIVLALVFFAFSITAFGQQINILDAMDENLIAVSARGLANPDEESETGEGRYYGECMRMKISNRSNKPVDIKVPNGLELESTDPDKQDMVVTQPMIVSLDAGETRRVNVYAMCTEKEDASPDRSIAYNVGDMAPRDLVNITSALNDLNMHSLAGQGAVWSFTNNSNVYDLSEFGLDEYDVNQMTMALNHANVNTPVNDESDPNYVRYEDVQNEYADYESDYEDYDYEESDYEDFPMEDIEGELEAAAELERQLEAEMREFERRQEREETKMKVIIGSSVGILLLVGLVFLILRVSATSKRA